MAKGKGKRTGQSAQELRAFRSQVAKLKKAGLVSSRVDARKQKATRYMKAKVKALSPVISGEMAGVKVGRDILQRYREGGFQVVNGRVLVAKDHDEIARARKGELIVLRKLTRNYPFEKVVMPYRVQTMGDFFREAKKSPPDPVIFASKKNETDFWAFTFYGWNSLQAYADQGLLAAEFEKYQTIEGASPEELTEIFENFILYRTTDSWSPRSRPGYTDKTNPRRKMRTVQDRRLEMRGRATMQKAESYAERNARNQKDWRERQKQKAASDPAFAAKQREKQRQRMKAYRDKKKREG